MPSRSGSSAGASSSTWTTTLLTRRRDLVGQVVERGLDETVEVVGLDLHGHAASVGGRPAARWATGGTTKAGPERVLRTGLVATPTGLEPAASAVTGRRANQLRYGAR